MQAKTEGQGHRYRNRKPKTVRQNQEIKTDRYTETERQ